MLQHNILLLPVYFHKVFDSHVCCVRGRINRGKNVYDGNLVGEVRVPGDGDVARFTILLISEGRSLRDIQGVTR